MSNLPILQNLQADARALASDLGVTTRDLTPKELIRFGRSYQRQFVKTYAPRQVVDIYVRHQAEALLGAMIAKEQMDAEIDDEQPASNKIGGPLPIRACWFGIGDDWEDLNGIYAGVQAAWSTGLNQNWIHAGTTMMAAQGGVVGGPIRILENAVHVVFGIEDLHAAPRIEAFRFTIDGKQKPILLPFFVQRTLPGLERPVKELDNAYVFKKDTTLHVGLFISNAFGAVSLFQTCFPRLVGVSYIKEPALRIKDPIAENLAGNVFNVVNI